MLQTIKTGLITAAVLAISLTAAAHCQIPCGIYDDELRVQLIEEHIGTIEKSMKQIVALGKASPADYNQIVRWVGNKEEHANQIQEIVTQYFLAQRIKVPASPEGEAYATYQHHLELLHKLLVTAMKAKQSTDLAHVQTMRGLVKELRKSYFDHNH
jgi:nickel superoxide dismutase